VLGGATLQNNITTGLSLVGTGYENDALLESLNAAPREQYSFYKGQYKYAGMFARITYNWDDKYIFDLNGRRDGSSRFGPGKQYGNFGSVGTAYIFSEEKYVKDNLSWLSLGKIRVSYGTTGNDQIGDYAFLTRWAFGQYNYNGTQTLTPTQHTDSLLHWEVNRKLEFGMDLAFLKDRITFTASWYQNRCSDQLVQEPLPTSTGFSSVVTNLPADVQNTGLEFILSGKIVDNEAFKWDSHFSIGFNRNKLIAFPNLAQSPYAFVYVVGQSLGITEVLHYTGVDPQTGFYTFQDKNHDGQITITGNHIDDDTHPVDLAPKFDGSFSNHFTYKNWELFAMFYFKKGLGYSAIETLTSPGDLNNQPLQVIQNAWYKPGDVAQYARLATYAGDQSYANFFRSDGVITDASFIRLQNVQLAYAFPKKSYLKWIEKGSIFIRADNLFVLTKYQGADPEVQNLQSLPLPLTITMGISVTL
jgi:TonB dependent receptor